MRKIKNQIPLAILLSLMAGCSLTPIARSKATPAAASGVVSVQLPTIDEKAIPNTGSVVEYWPDGMKKSERIYKSGKMVSAVYYASDGRRVYEMVEAGAGN